MSSTTSADALTSTNESPFHTGWLFQAAGFLLSLLANKTICEAFKRGISISCNTLEPPDISPIGFPSQTFWGLIFPVQIPGSRVPDVGFPAQYSSGRNLSDETSPAILIC